MLRPSDRSEMHQVKIVGHYGEPLIVDECEKCGGIWFDESELFRARQGEAERIEVVNAEMLRTPSMIEHPDLICTRDDATMQRFTDRSFPQDIVLMRCPSCYGIWLNRGIFTKYQQFRQGLMRVKKSPQDDKLRESIAQLTASYQRGRSTGTLRRLGEFLSISIDSSRTPDAGDATEAGGVADLALTTLLTILRLVFRL